MKAAAQAVTENVQLVEVMTEARMMPELKIVSSCCMRDLKEVQEESSDVLRLI